MQWTYFLIDFFTIIVPLLFSFHPKLRFYLYFKPFFAANAIVLLVFIAWDVLFTKMGIWGFNARYVFGWHIFNLPIEEVLFFICIPFACLFTYHCFLLFYNFDKFKKFENYLIPILIIFLCIVGLYYHSKLYTAVTSMSLSFILFLLKYVFKVQWLASFILVYLILLIPFFIVNGLLTGTGLEEPVVWYNNKENLGVRILTIPIEDFFYGFELLLLNTAIYNFFKNSFNNEGISFKKQMDS